MREKFLIPKFDYSCQVHETVVGRTSPFEIVRPFQADQTRGGRGFSIVCPDRNASTSGLLAHKPT